MISLFHCGCGWILTAHQSGCSFFARICIATTRNHLNLALISYAFVYAYTSKIFAYYDFPHSHAFLLKDNNHISIFQEARHISSPSPFTFFMHIHTSFMDRSSLLIKNRRGTCARGDCIRTSLISWYRQHLQILQMHFRNTLEILYKYYIKVHSY